MVLWRRALDGKDVVNVWTGLRAFKDSNYVFYFATLFLTHFYMLDINYVLRLFK